MARAVLLAVWLADETIKAGLMEAVSAIRSGTDANVIARRTGTGGRRRTIARLLTAIAGALPAAESEAAHAADCLALWREKDVAEITPGQRHLVEANAGRNLDDRASWALEFAIGRIALTSAYHWTDDGPVGHQIRPGRSHDDAALALGRRLARVCVTCGTPLRRSRAGAYCAAHESDADRRIEDKIDHLITLVAASC